MKFAFVARGSVPIAEFPGDDPELRKKALNIFSKMPPGCSESWTGDQDHMSLTVKPGGDVSFACLHDKSVTAPDVEKFLVQVKTNWLAHVVQQTEDDSEFAAKLKDLMDEFNAAPVVHVTSEAPPAGGDDVPEELPLVNDRPMFDQENDAELRMLRMRNWCSRHRVCVLVLVGLLVWEYLTLAVYCRDPTLVKCFRK